MTKKLLILSALSLPLSLSAMAEEPAVEPAKPAVEEAELTFKNHEEGLVAMLGMMEEMGDVFAGVTDVASAEKAVPALTKLKAKGDKLQAAMLKLGEPTEEEQKALEAKYKDRMEAAQKKFMGAMMTLMSKPEIAEILQGAM